MSDREIKQVPVARCHPGTYQPRRHFDEQALRELAQSMRADTQIQPIVVRPAPELPEGDYEILAGERRWRAAKINQWETIEAVVQSMDDELAAGVALTENFQRDNLTPLERAAGLARYAKTFGLSHAKVAERLGLSRAAVSNEIRLLELEESVQAMVEEGKLPAGAARPLLILPPGSQAEIAKMAVRYQWTTRRVEDKARELAQTLGKGGSQEPAQSKDPDRERLERLVGEALGFPVQITDQTVCIRYHGDMTMLDALLDRIGAGEQSYGV